VKVHADGTRACKKTVSRRLESQEEGGPQKSICWPKMLVGQSLFDSPLATVMMRWKEKAG
jgi:hypothetical protein